MKVDGLPRNYVGVPACFELELWAADVRAFFDATPYLVGTATRGREFRDVDVRVLLWPAEWDRFFPGVRATGDGGGGHDRGWTALCVAFSTWGRARTGLPIDFQVQHAERANEAHEGGRVPLGLNVVREVPS